MAESKANATVLVIDDDTEIRYSLQRVLSSRGFEVVEAESGEKGLEVAESINPEVILLDNRMEGMSGLETLQHLRTSVPTAMIILMTAYSNTQTVIEAMKFGAFDYVSKPFDVKKLVAMTENAARSHADLDKAENAYQPLLNSEDYKEGIVGSGEAMREVFKLIGQVAASDATVMITGESGTGKELVARCIYQHSHRTRGNFIAVNCAAIPENLIESELFGHEKGSFTGATGQRAGKFELCDKGTIFLDEIGDMSLSTQTKILRALQEGEIQRVGGSETIKVDVRLVAATNKPLEELVEKKEFREDLYYRLNVVRVHLPPLRERKEDIPELVDFMVQRLAKDRKTHVKTLSPAALNLLKTYHWPGNVRELENVIYRSAVIAQGETILIKDLPDEIRRCGEAAGEPTSEPDSAEAPVAGGDTIPPFAASAPDWDTLMDQVFRYLRDQEDKQMLQTLEAAMIERALRETEGNQARAAGIVGMTRATLRKRIEQYSIQVES
ncbi:MAG: sigma-54-dependent transcriptional regulator [Opitutales bacterium]